MAIDPDRIRALAEDPSVVLPHITAAQADATVRLLNIPTTWPRPGGEKSDREQPSRDRQQ